MNVTINGVEFAKTGTHGCRWMPVHPMWADSANMMIDSACDQIAALSKVRDAAKVLIDSLTNGGIFDAETKMVEALESAEKGNP